MPESFYNQITARLSKDGAKMWTSSNPSSPYHWFYTKVLKRLRELNGIYLHFTMEDNPSLSEEVKERYRKMYYGVWKSRYILGKWVTADGLIYDGFDDKLNVIDDSLIPYEDIEKFVIGVDYGTSNATAFLLCGRTQNGVFYICKEYYFAGREEAEAEGSYEARKTDLEYTEDMRRFIGESYNDTQLTYRDIRIVLDPAANSFKVQMRRFHMKTKNANNSVLDGIRTVSSLMFQRRLLVSDSCKNLIKEIHTYSWDTKKTETSGKDVPLKKDDHLCIVGTTLINTVDGYKQIKDMVGTTGYVNTVDLNTGEYCVKEYSNVSITEKNASIVRVEFDNGDYVDITENHPVFTNRGWVKVKDLSLSDDIISI